MQDQIVYVPIDTLKANEYNPRQATQKDFADLKRSISKFGLKQPIIVNKHEGRENVIVGGHFRVRVCKDLGWTEVPVLYVDLNEADEMEMNIRLNKNTGSWDNDMLMNIGVDNLIDFGFSRGDIENVTGGESIEEESTPPAGMELRDFEKYDYLVFVFKNEVDWLNACQKFGVERANYSFSPKSRKIGLGRIIDGKRLLDNGVQTDNPQS